MKTFFNFFLVVLRIYICFKVVVLLYNCHSNPDQETLSNLNWWIYYLIFDIWLQINVNNTKEESE